MYFKCILHRALRLWERGLMRVFGARLRKVLCCAVLLKMFRIYALLVSNAELTIHELIGLSLAGASSESAHLSFKGSKLQAA